MDSFDFLHPQLYKKKGNAYEASNDNNCGVTEEYDPKGKAPIVDVPSDADSDDTSSGSDSEDDERTLSVQVLAEDDGNETVWFNRYKKVWGAHVEAAQRLTEFDDDTGNTEQFVDVDTMFVCFLVAVIATVTIWLIL
ncbi:uncharacterized protein LOC113320714 [Papaver somniferum]|uniref:uncharacterized protein LOC113320714 n=1 Tax=Papaver somniferum TaxID=3469 RepID=UPI000E6FD2E2|nr:uncharacterized protein LOC113320714 [Papaver somniferum]